MKILKYTLSTNLLICLMYNSVTLGSTVRRSLSESDSLSQLLHDREVRVNQFNLLTSKVWISEVMTITANALLNARDTFLIPERFTKPYSLISLVFNFVLHTSLDYRREAYQLIRDLDIEIAPKLYDRVPCIRNAYSYESPTDPPTENNTKVYSAPLFRSIHRLGNCLNLTYVDEQGNKVDPEVPGQFTNLTSSNSPVIQRIRLILNALIRLLSNIDKDKEFVGGKTQWYDEVSEENHQHWKKLVHYVPIFEPVAPILITENDEGEKLSLLEERRWRDIAFDDSDFPDNFKSYLSQLDEVLDDLYSYKKPDLSNITFPQLNFKVTSVASLIEFCELIRDFIKILGSMVYTTTPVHTVDFLGVDHVHEPFVRDSDVDPRDEVFNSTIFSELRFAAKLYNLTYVDENGNMIETIDGRVRGKYVYPFNSSESSVSRQLRHMINGFERFYFNTLRNKNVPLRIRNENVRNGTYHPTIEFIDDEIPKEELDQQNLLVYQSLERAFNSSQLSPHFYNIINAMKKFKIDQDESDLMKSGVLSQFVLFDEASKYLANETRETREEAYTDILHLYFEQWIPENANVQRQKRHPWIINAKRVDICKVDTNCPHVLLRLLQVLGRDYFLRYVDEYGEEVLIDDTLLGKFTFATGNSLQEPFSYVRRIKLYLNKLLELLRQANHK